MIAHVLTVTYGILSYLWPSRERKREVLILRMRRPCLWLATSKSVGSLRTHLQALWTHFSAFLHKYQCMLKTSQNNTAYKNWFEVSWVKGLELGWWSCEWIQAGEELEGSPPAWVVPREWLQMPTLVFHHCWYRQLCPEATAGKSCLDILIVLTYQSYNSSTATSGPYFSMLGWHNYSSNPHTDAELLLNS